MMFRVVFWDILPFKMIVDRRFRGAYCLHHSSLMRLLRDIIAVYNENHTKRYPYIHSVITNVGGTNTYHCDYRVNCVLAVC
jgi:hypothetical protein